MSTDEPNADPGSEPTPGPAAESLPHSTSELIDPGGLQVGNGWTLAPAASAAPVSTVPLEAMPMRPRLIPNLGHTVVFLALLIPSFIGGFILSFVIFLAILHPASAKVVLDRVSHEIRFAIAAQGIVYGVQWALAGFVFTLWWGQSMLKGIHWNAAAAKRFLLLLAALGIATGLAMTVAGNFVPMPKAPPILEDLTRSRVGAFMMMLFGVTLAPLTEELGFRGFLLPSLINVFRWLARRGTMAESAVRSVGIPASVLITSFCFAMVHSGQVSHSWGPLLLIGTVSVILCIVRLWADSVAAGVIVHAAYNLTLFTALLVQTGGFKHLEKLNQ